MRWHITVLIYLEYFIMDHEITFFRSLNVIWLISWRMLSYTNRAEGLDVKRYKCSKQKLVWTKLFYKLTNISISNSFKYNNNWFVWHVMFSVRCWLWRHNGDGVIVYSVFLWWYHHSCLLVQNYVFYLKFWCFVLIYILFLYEINKLIIKKIILVCLGTTILVVRRII